MQAISSTSNAVQTLARPQQVSDNRQAEMQVQRKQPAQSPPEPAKAQTPPPPEAKPAPKEGAGQVVNQIA